MWESTLRVACSDPLWWRATCNSFVQCSIVSNCFPSIESFIHSSLVSASQSIRLTRSLNFGLWRGSDQIGSTRTYFLVGLWKNHFPIRKGDRAHQSSLYQMFWGMLCVHFRTPLKLRWWPLKIHENIMSCYVAMLPSPQYHRERESSTLSKLNMKRIDKICLFGAAVLN